MDVIVIIGVLGSCVAAAVDAMRTDWTPTGQTVDDGRHDDVLTGAGAGWARLRAKRPLVAASGALSAGSRHHHHRPA